MDIKSNTIRSKSISKIACGSEHACLISQGEVYSFGLGTSGQLGSSSFTSNNGAGVPVSGILSKREAVQVTCGRFHTLVITSDGNASSFGDNSYSQLGAGLLYVLYSKISVPVPVDTSFALRGRNVNQASCGAYHCILLTSSGDLVGYGSNSYGQLGLGFVSNVQVSPAHINLLNESVSLVACGDYHTIALTSSGRVMTFGDNDDGQLGLGSIKSQNRPTFIESSIMAGKFFVNAAAGSSHTILVASDGSLYSFGSNDDGQLGVPGPDRSSPVLVNFDGRVSQVACGSKHSLITDDNQDVYSFGDNDEGQLGINNRNSRSSPTLIPNLSSSQMSAGKSFSLVLRSTTVATPYFTSTPTSTPTPTPTQTNSLETTTVPTQTTTVESTPTPSVQQTTLTATDTPAPTPTVSTISLTTASPIIPSQKWSQTIVLMNVTTTSTGVTPPLLDDSFLIFSDPNGTATAKLVPSQKSIKDVQDLQSVNLQFEISSITKINDAVIGIDVFSSHATVGSGNIKITGEGVYNFDATSFYKNIVKRSLKR
ncbi:ultraviolet-B receptor UVR8 [Acrasis kona]|uniref:Ultraviolet-B receptor UVR8 n=1 Tax=Acrasis kona TaxID=1008807 RepID=A0AAW2YPN8_9EUKA